MSKPAKSMTSTVAADHNPMAHETSRRTSLLRKVRREVVIGWLFALPALLMYATFVLFPLLLSLLYSFFRWDGIGAMTWVGLKNYQTVLEVPNLLGTISNAFRLVFFFSLSR